MRQLVYVAWIVSAVKVWAGGTKLCRSSEHVNLYLFGLLKYDIIAEEFTTNRNIQYALYRRVQPTKSVSEDTFKEVQRNGKCIKKPNEFIKIDLFLTYVIY